MDKTNEKIIQLASVLWRVTKSDENTSSKSVNDETTTNGRIATDERKVTTT